MRKPVLFINFDQNHTLMSRSTSPSTLLVHERRKYHKPLLLKKMTDAEKAVVMLEAAHSRGRPSRTRGRRWKASSDPSRSRQNTSLQHFLQLQFEQKLALQHLKKNYRSGGEVRLYEPVKTYSRQVHFGRKVSGNFFEVFFSLCTFF